MNSAKDIFLRNFWDFEFFFWIVASKVIPVDEIIFKIGFKVTNIASVEVVLMSLF